MRTPWTFLEEYRGTLFHGQWPTIPEMFEITRKRVGDRQAFIAFEPAPLSFTYPEVLEQVLRVAAYLQSQGVQRGDRLALTGKNSPEWVIGYLGILFAGAVVVLLDYQLGVDELSALLRFAGAKLLFVDEEKYDGFDVSSSGIKDLISLSPSRPGYILELPVSGQLHREAVDDEEPAGSPCSSGCRCCSIACWGD